MDVVYAVGSSAREIGFLDVEKSRVKKPKKKAKSNRKRASRGRRIVLQEGVFQNSGKRSQHVLKNLSKLVGLPC